MRANRKGFLIGLLPPNASMPQGSNRFASSTHNLTAVWWKDRKDVFVMSTLHKKAVEEVMRPKGAKEKSTHCPSMIVDYNQNMGGVDLTDQYLSYYSLTKRRTLKWWKKVFWRLIDMCAKFMGYLSIQFFKLHNTHKLFRLKQLLKSSFSHYLPCVPLQNALFTFIPKAETLLPLMVASLGSTFPTSTPSASDVLFAVKKSHQVLVKEWTRKLKTIAPSAMFFCALENFLKHTIHRQVIRLYVQHFVCSN